MRIVVWNCRMALARKRELLYQLKPDIAVLPECSRDAMLLCQREGYDTRWWGDNKSKGLGVLAAPPWSLDAPPQSRPKPRQKWIAPVEVRGPLKFLLLAVWAMPVGNVKETNYVGQIYEAIVRHPRWFNAGKPVVVCGDFNSNTIWDEGRKRRTHSAVVQLLGARGIVSAYHTFFAEEHGRETRPTYYFWHREDRAFHIDYIFVPRAWAAGITDCQIGAFAAWRSSSDHVPLVVEIVESHKSEKR